MVGGDFRRETVKTNLKTAVIFTEINTNEPKFAFSGYFFLFGCCQSSLVVYLFVCFVLLDRFCTLS